MNRKLIVALGVVVLAALTATAQLGPDLDVTYIARTPRYNRYVIDESRGIPQQLAPGTENDKRWPDAGELVTYRAHVRNSGTVPIASFVYEWRVDGTIIGRATYTGPIAPGQEVTVLYRTPWTTEPQTIAFRADPANVLQETVETNNSRRTGSYDLSISIWIEQGMYDLFAQSTKSGSQTFEDWLQMQFAAMNDRFANAIYPVSSNGMIDRVRVEKIVVAPELDGPGSPLATDPHLLLIDGRWAFTDGDPTNKAGEAGKWQEYVDAVAGRVDDGLIHELAHQLGVIDLYRMNIMPDEPDHPNGGVSVKDSSGRIVTYDRLPFPVFCCGGIMGGGDTLPYNDGTMFESHTAAGMNAHARYRRGHYGDYLFDTPDSNRVRIIDASTGAAVPGAYVAFYQKDYNTEEIDDAPEIAGTTDASGFLLLPNRRVLGFSTATGHTLRANPFGQINNVGVNGTMLVRVTKGTLEGFAFFRLHDLNLAYHDIDGARTKTYRLNVAFAPIAPPLANLPPNLDAVGPKTIAEGQTLRFVVSASDPRGEPVTITAPRIPPGATFANQTFTWTPGFAQAGFHSVEFVVTDASGLTDSETILVTVTDVSP